MYHSAFHLNQDFLSAICERITTLKERYINHKDYGNLFSKPPAIMKEQLAQIIDSAYWASHALEEGHRVRLSIVFKECEHSSTNFCFDNPLPLNAKNLVKLGSALESSFSDICIFSDAKDHLRIWGLRMRSPSFLMTDLWIQVLGPGKILVICFGRSIAALTGNQAVFIDPTRFFEKIIQKICSESASAVFDSRTFLRFSTVLSIAQEMRAHACGGTLLVVPDGSSWKKSIGHPLIYTGGASFLDQDFTSLQSREHPPSLHDLFTLFKEQTIEHNELFRTIRAHILDQCHQIGRLTATDGALVMTYDRYVHCFGAKIQGVVNQPGAAEVHVLRPVEGDRESTIIFADLGGTRHYSAAQFAFDQPDSIAIVASQDGDVSFFTRDTVTGELLVVQQAELALMYEGIGGYLWNLSPFVAAN